MERRPGKPKTSRPAYEEALFAFPEKPYIPTELEEQHGEQLSERCRELTYSIEHIQRAIMSLEALREQFLRQVRSIQRTEELRPLLQQEKRDLNNLLKEQELLEHSLDSCIGQEQSLTEELRTLMEAFDAANKGGIN